MSKANDLVLPGEHSHSDRPNWRPAETVEEYLSNIAEGLERYSVERMTKMLGLNRTQAWRCKQMGNIPEGLFNRLLKGGVGGTKYGTKQLAQIGLWLSRGEGNQPSEVERCPHCNGVVRVRWMIGTRAAKIIEQWINDGKPDNTFGEREDETVIYLPDRSTAVVAPIREG